MTIIRPGIGIEGELNVGTTGFDADFANDGEAGVTHSLVFFVGQRLSRCDGDRIARVNTHRIEVFDGADDHDVVVEVPHDFHLVLFPADDGFFDQDFGGRRLVESSANQCVEFVPVVGDCRTAAAHREAGPDHARQTDSFENDRGLLRPC